MLWAVLIYLPLQGMQPPPYNPDDNLPYENTTEDKSRIAHIL